ncbi:hypothetical protein [Chitinophaga barathri]|uniref:Uncharacterized protein n=1 Tax=Chitinophaga barathri TaxID=1647451 RepID=A0A3N4M5Y1_9BACT|nr:hypothetical protein [Chitinophaga barathri]RPD38455.1 hypothetical protein EG028_24605 [Chitinophaga barathri]
MHHPTSLPKIAGFASIFIGVITAAFAFISKSAEAAIYLGAAGVLACLVSLVIARKNIDELQMAVAGLFLSIVATGIGVWQLYNF